MNGTEGRTSSKFFIIFSPAIRIRFELTYRWQPGDLGSFVESSVASRRKRGPVAFRPRLSAGLAFSLLFTKNSTVGQVVQSVNRTKRYFGRLDACLGRFLPAESLSPDVRSHLKKHQQGPFNEHKSQGPAFGITERAISCRCGLKGHFQMLTSLCG